MSANIETMAYKGKEPWHGLGVTFEGEPTADEMLQLAGLNWSVSTRPLFTTSQPSARLTEVPESGDLLVEGNQALVRDKDNAILDVVGPKYVPFQNTDVMRAFDHLCKAGNLKFETAGALDGGRWVWALAKMEKAFILPGDDLTESYLLMSHPHVFGKSFVCHLTPIRVVCQNTLQVALRTRLSDQFRMAHRVLFDQWAVGEMEKIVGQAIQGMVDYENQARFLASCPWKDETAAYYFSNVLSYSKSARKGSNDNKSLKELSHTPGHLAYLYEHGPGAEMKAAKHTAWGAFNAVTYYIDHQYGTGNQGQRLTNAWYGVTSIYKRQALDFAVEVAKGKAA